MKNLQTILNIIFGIGIIALGVLHFTTKTQPNKRTQKVAINNGKDSIEVVTKTPLVYFNIDSLTKNYKLYQVEKSKLEGTTKLSEQQLVAKQKGLEGQVAVFQKEMADYQQRAQYLTITEREAKEKVLTAKQQQLQKLEQDFEVLRQNLAAASMKIGADAEKKIYDKVTLFLKDYSQENGFEYVIGQTTGSGIWYADSTHDITNEVIEKLNEAYEIENKK